MTGILLYNAKIYTLNDQQPTAGAIAIEHGRILAVGDSIKLRAEFSGRIPAEDLRGQVLLPGLTDAHLHLQHYALSLDMVDCETATRAECLQRIAERAKSTPPGEWIRGHGWNQNAWQDGVPGVNDLDQVAPRNPVYLTHKSLHSAWSNHAALKLANLDDSSPDPDIRLSVFNLQTAYCNTAIELAVNRQVHYRAAIVAAFCFF